MTIICSSSLKSCVPLWMDKLRAMQIKDSSGSMLSYIRYQFYQGNRPSKTKDIILEKNRGGNYYKQGSIAAGSKGHRWYFENNDIGTSGYYIGHVMGDRKEIRYEIAVPTGTQVSEAKQHFTTDYDTWTLGSNVSQGSKFVHVTNRGGNFDQWWIYEIISAGSTDSNNPPVTNQEKIGEEQSSNSCTYKLIAVAWKFSCTITPDIKATISIDWGAGEEECYKQVRSWPKKGCIESKKNTTDFGTCWNEYSYRITTRLKSNHTLFFSIDAEKSFGDAMEKLNLPGRSHTGNYDTCLYVSGKHYTTGCEVNGDVRVQYDLMGWIKEDGISITDALGDPSLVVDTGETEEEIQQLDRFLGQTREQLIEAAINMFKEKDPKLKLTDELITIGDKGDLVQAIHEQLRNIGFEVENPNVFSANSYSSVIELKKHMERVDNELYVKLQISTPCGSPPFPSAEFPQCHHWSDGPCGCVTYSTYAFLHHLVSQPQPSPNTGWIFNFEDTNKKGINSPFKKVAWTKQIRDNITLNDPDVLPVSNNHGVDLQIKEGWEVKLGVTAWDGAVQKSTNFNQQAVVYYELKGGDRLVVNTLFAPKKWDRSDSQGAFKHPIYHVVRTENENTGAKVTPKNKPLIQVSAFSGITIKIELIDIKAPWSEWAMFGDRLPPGWGVEYGASAITKFARTFGSSFTGEIQMEAGLYLGLRLSIIAIFELAVGIFARGKFTFSDSDPGLKLIYGWSAEAAAGIGSYSGQVKGRVSYPYQVEHPGDIPDSFLHLIDRICLAMDMDGISDWVDFSGAKPLPVEAESSSKLTTPNYEDTEKWVAESNLPVLNKLDSSVKEWEREFIIQVANDIELPTGLLCRVKASDLDKSHGQISLDIGMNLELLNSMNKIKKLFIEIKDNDEVLSFKKLKNNLEEYSKKKKINMEGIDLEWEVFDVDIIDIEGDDHMKNLEQYLEFFEKGKNISGGKNIDMIANSNPFAMKKSLWTFNFQVGGRFIFCNVPKGVLTTIIGAPLGNISTLNPCTFIDWFSNLFSTWDRANSAGFEMKFEVFGELSGEYKFNVPFLQTPWVRLIFELIIDAKASAAWRWNLANLTDDFWQRPDVISQILAAEATNQNNGNGGGN